MAVNKKFNDLIISLGYEFQDGYSEHKKILVILGLLGSVVIIGAVTLVLGAYAISLETIGTIVITHLTMGDLTQVSKLHNSIIWDIRLPPGDIGNNCWRSTGDIRSCVSECLQESTG